MPSNGIKKAEGKGNLSKFGFRGGRTVSEFIAGGGDST